MRSPWPWSSAKASGHPWGRALLAAASVWTGIAAAPTATHAQTGAVTISAAPPASAAVGASFDVPVVLTVPAGLRVGTFTVDLQYNPSVVRAVGCTAAAAAGGACNPAWETGSVRMVGATTGGLTGTVNLAVVQFTGVSAGTSPLTIHPDAADSVTDADGLSLPTILRAASLAVGSGAAAGSVTTLPAPTATPRPAAPAPTAIPTPVRPPLAASAPAPTPTRIASAPRAQPTAIPIPSAPPSALKPLPPSVAAPALPARAPSPAFSPALVPAPSPAGLPRAAATEAPPASIPAPAPESPAMTPLPEPLAGLVDPAFGAVLTTPDGILTLYAPPAASGDPFLLAVSPMSMPVDPSAALVVVLDPLAVERIDAVRGETAYGLAALDTAGAPVVAGAGTVAGPFILSVRPSAGDLLQAGGDPARLSLAAFDPDAATWFALPTGLAFDGALTATLDRLTTVSVAVRLAAPADPPALEPAPAETLPSEPVPADPSLPTELDASYSISV